jgi:hypothetical protein
MLEGIIKVFALIAAAGVSVIAADFLRSFINDEPDERSCASSIPRPNSGASGAVQSHGNASAQKSRESRARSTPTPTLR